MGKQSRSRIHSELRCRPLQIPWKTLCGTAITITALALGYDGYLALVAVCALFGVELYGQRTKKEG